MELTPQFLTIIARACPGSAQAITQANKFIYYYKIITYSYCPSVPKPIELGLEKIFQNKKLLANQPRLPMRLPGQHGQIGKIL